MEWLWLRIKILKPKLFVVDSIHQAMNMLVRYDRTTMLFCFITFRCAMCAGTHQYAILISALATSLQALFGPLIFKFIKYSFRNILWKILSVPKTTYAHKVEPRYILIWRMYELIITRYLYLFSLL